MPRLPLPQVRVHDECNGSDVFGSDICTCRPYLIHGIEECIRSAQEGGAGLIVYFRKEGRALGEVTKFMVYNARKRQQGGDSAQTYFKRTEMIAGVQVREKAGHARRSPRHHSHTPLLARAGHALPGADARPAPLAR